MLGVRSMLFKKEIENVRKHIRSGNGAPIRKLWNWKKAQVEKSHQLRSDRERERNDNNNLLEELTNARDQWKCAQKKLDYVIEKDQIDYAIFSLEAAEKRYEMLLRKAKREKVYEDPYGLKQKGRSR